MFDKVIVGVDGRDGGVDAIALTRRLASPGAAVIFANVYGVGTAGGRSTALAVPVELEAAQQMLDRAEGQSGLSVEPAAIYESSVGRGLHQLAEERRADLLVVGSCQRGRLGRTLLGDDTSGVLNGAPCAVAIAPRGYSVAAPESRRLARIGVGYDGSTEAAWALAVARGIARGHSAAITVLRVVPIGELDQGQTRDRWPDMARQLCEEELDRLRELEGIQPHAVWGEPGEELATFSDELDLLIVGSRSYGPVGRLFNGSTSNYLARHARSPLLVLPRRAGRLRQAA